METTATTKAAIIAEWYDNRFGAEVFGALINILRLAGATEFTIPTAWLDFQPNGQEGEIAFRFAHTLSWENGETAPVIKALREVARIKSVDWDTDAPRDWDYD
jgi:hypothetical protein